MTPTEIIATKLFGWERCERDTQDSRRYEHPKGGVAFVSGELDGGGFGPAGGEDWPDLTDWLWIQRMEDALLQQELLDEYVNALRALASNKYPWCENYQMLSTAEQRVAACVKVLEGVQ